jgi:magnesium-dependent phosphatase 1
MALNTSGTSVLLVIVLACFSTLVSGFQNPSIHLNSRCLQGARQQPSFLFTLPKLIVFDLDNTLWTPELYQLRKHQRTNTIPVAGRDIKLMEGAQAALQLKESMPDTKFAVASRTKSVEWAHDLLQQFDIYHLFDFVEIFPGNKRTHFENIKRESGVKFSDMLFFDDARDGKYGNCQPVSQMGVLSVHCPSGLHTPDIFHTGLQRYKEWNKSPSTIVEWDGTMNNNMDALTIDSSDTTSKRITGEVKMCNEAKGYGFICPDNGNGKDVFFHFSNLPEGVVVEEGDKLSFVLCQGNTSGKTRAERIKLVTSNADDDDMIKMYCFSMNMPFAGLLANKYKTLETRNGTMFTTYPEGTQMLLHVGQRTYPDGNRHLEIMKSAGLSDDEIQKLKSLPPGFGKGMAVAILEIGKTYETTLEERSDPEFQRNVAAYGKDSGRMVTEIKRVEYLKTPVRQSGQGGVFKVDVDRNVLPDGWELSSDNLPYKTRNEISGRRSTSSSDEASAVKNGACKNGKSKPVYSISG